MGLEKAADYDSLLKLLKIPHEFPPNCIEIDYLYDGFHLGVTLRWRHNSEEPWMHTDMLPLLVGDA